MLSFEWVKATTVADQEGVDVRLYTVIYDAVNDVRDAMEGLLDPAFREKVMGRAEVHLFTQRPARYNAFSGSVCTSGEGPGLQNQWGV